MSEITDPSKAHLRTEITTRIREALELHDWKSLDGWARQWIQLEPRLPSGFKWLARAALAQNQIQRAAYAYGRLLDFEPSNEEARKFFASHPSSLSDQPESVSHALRSQDNVNSDHERITAGLNRLSPEQRRRLAQAEYELAEIYSSYKLHAESAPHYLKSHQWHPSKAAALGGARSLHQNHNGLEASRFLRNQLYHFPDWIEGRLLLGRILLELGHKSDAQREWQIVLEHEAKNQEALDFLRGLLQSS